MKIYSWNVNGIRAVQKKGLFEPFLKEHQPDILCLQETKAQPEQVESEFAALFPEYEQYWHSAEKKGYSGTAIFTKESPEEVIYGLPDSYLEQYELGDEYGNSHGEGRVITAEYEHFYVSSVYTPNAKDNLGRLKVRQQWDQAFLAFMQELESEKPVIFCGDLNVAHTENDLARPKENRGKKGFTDEERAGFDALVAADYTDSFRLFHEGNGFYTWWSHFGGARERNVGWRIDYVMVSSQLKELIKRGSIHPNVMGSDHCPVSIDITLS